LNWTSTGESNRPKGRRTSVTDQNGKTTTYAYDDADRLTSVTDAANHVTTYGYDTENNLTSIKDAAAITAEGDEVEIAASVEALQAVAHEKVWDKAKSKTSPTSATYKG
jgi:YD repeat-containing protein